MSEFFPEPSLYNENEKLPPHRFSWRPKLNEDKSKEAGRPVYEDAPWIDVHIDAQSAISRYASAKDLDRYRRGYEAFLKDNSSEGIIGTRLEEWPLMNRSMVEEFRYFKIRTVENLAQVADSQLQNLPQGREWRDRAKAWLAAAGVGAPVAKLADEMRALRSELDAMKKQRDDAMKELDRATDPGKRKG